MEHNSNDHSSVNDDDITDKIAFGTQLAIDRLIEREKKEDGYLVVEQDGKVVTLRARDIITSRDINSHDTP